MNVQDILKFIELKRIELSFNLANTKDYEDKITLFARLSLLHNFNDYIEQLIIIDDNKENKMTDSKDDKNLLKLGNFIKLLTDIYNEHGDVDIDSSYSDLKVELIIKTIFEDGMQITKKYLEIG